VLEAVENLVAQQKELPNESPFGDGKAAERIVKIIKQELFGV